MVLEIALVVVAMVALAALELWLFWTLGERDDRRRRREPAPERRRGATWHARVIPSTDTAPSGGFAPGGRR